MTGREPSGLYAASKKPVFAVHAFFGSQRDGGTRSGRPAPSSAPRPRLHLRGVLAVGRDRVERDGAVLPRDGAITNGSVDFGPTTMKGIDGSAFWPFGLPPMIEKSSRICVPSPRGGAQALVRRGARDEIGVAVDGRRERRQRPFVRPREGARRHGDGRVGEVTVARERRERGPECMDCRRGVGARTGGGGGRSRLDGQGAHPLHARGVAPGSRSSDPRGEGATRSASWIEARCRRGPTRAPAAAREDPRDRGPQPSM
jgi:hypothetical protein